MKKVIVAVVVASFLLTLGGCNFFKSEKQKFIDATIESTCYVLGQASTYNAEVEQGVKDIYAEYGFDSEDKVKMEEIAQKYKEDPDVQNEILQALTECGGETAPATEEPAPTEETAPATETAPVEEAVPAETPAETK